MSVGTLCCDRSLLFNQMGYCMPPDVGPSYHTFASSSRHAQEVLARTSEILVLLDAPQRGQQLRAIRELLASDVFRLLVVGEMKRGKSTLINAMMGELVLPRENLPCTGVVTRVRYDNTKRAVLHYRDGAPQRELDLSNSLDALWEAIKIPQPSGDDDDADAGEATSPYSIIDVFYPLTLLRDRLELVDSPGLNEYRARTVETLSLLSQSDAMIVVLRCDSPLHETEQKFIEEDLKHHSLRNVFVVWNRVDTLEESPDELQKLRAFSRQRIENRFPGVRVFFVSAARALRARQQGNAALLRESGVPALESALESFLANERAAAKLRMPLRVVGAEIEHALLELIPQREHLVRESLERLRAKLEECQPQLVEAERIRQRILASVDRCTEALLREAVSSVFSVVVKLESGAAEQARSFPISTWDMVLRAKRTRERLVTSIEEWISDRLETWQRQTLPSIVETHLAGLRSDLEQQAKEIFEKLDAVKATFQVRVGVPVQEDGAEVSALDRLLGAGLGVLGGPGSMVEGATFGVGHMTRGLGVHLLAGASLVALGFALPVIVPALVLIGTLRSILRAGSAANDLRDVVVRACQDSIRKAVPVLESELREKLKEMMADVRATLDERLSVQVNEVKQQVEGVIRDREQENRSTEERLNDLREVRDELRALLGTVRKLQDTIEQTVATPSSVDTGSLANQLVEPITQGIVPQLKEAIAATVPSPAIAQLSHEGIIKDIGVVIEQKNTALLHGMRQASRAEPGETLQGRDRDIYKAVRAILHGRCKTTFADRCEELLEVAMFESAKFGIKAQTMRPVYRLMVSLALSREETSVPLPSRYRELLTADTRLAKELWAQVSERGELPSEETFARLYRKAHRRVCGAREIAKDVRGSKPGPNGTDR